VQRVNDRWMPTVTDRAILGMFGEYKWLSNFHLVPIEYEGRLYGSTEAAYMATKTLDEDMRDLLTTYSPLEAKAVGSQIELRPDWERLRVGVMLDVLRIKFRVPELREKLLETGDKYIEETNYWNDKYWGRCKGQGLNMLGHLIMAVRKECE
jgi:ribA/ribD-fused uncharacterized protein